MIVILEGLDCSGKTTIADYIANRFDMYRYHEYEHLKKLVPFDRDVQNWTFFEAGSVAYMLPMFKAFDDFVIDRFHISAYAYSRYFGRTEMISFEEKERLMVATCKKIHVVYCETDYESYVKRHKKRGEKFLSEEEFDKQKRLFEEGLKKTQFPISRFQTTGDEKETHRLIETHMIEQIYY